VKENNCYNCRHRCDVPGDAHSTCRHPKAQNDNPERSIVDLLRRLSKGGQITDFMVLSSMGVKLKEHGVKHGWANFPYNFDPIWVEECKSFEKLEN
jgi:hypothetical protein